MTRVKGKRLYQASMRMGLLSLQVPVREQPKRIPMLNRDPSERPSLVTIGVVGHRTGLVGSDGTRGPRTTARPREGLPWPVQRGWSVWPYSVLRYNKQDSPGKPIHSDWLDSNPDPRLHHGISLDDISLAVQWSVVSGQCAGSYQSWAHTCSHPIWCPTIIYSASHLEIVSTLLISGML
ncbi:hypothetical protein K493DRAFT_305084 [Basidiobolus meristosporus CBS 931.73]|uniref:Uncharacterized protein n=1 Tax=Basidiobolus meristosporus CBS 931.73 TaxID=1314790 RepID=A0A1Y1XX32_9FUNG|nr:hypothetical protein K493DRAFT_305084 [Basidiobolus meristosporus CBS 931.73]|eukprot:ORX90225.1 hypothetical protein K493DRAFT_305084 [Basidiobolus meristosporus CBS 931.73]